MKLYLIDTENTGSAHSCVFDLIQPGDRVYLFYTDANSGISVPVTDMAKATRKHVRVDAVPCRSGKNALDFQLSSYIGYLAGLLGQKGPDGPDSPQFVIISGDSGYDALIPFWGMRGINVSRKSALECQAETVTPAGITCPHCHNQVKRGIDLCSVCGSPLPGSRLWDEMTSAHAAQEPEVKVEAWNGADAAAGDGAWNNPGIPGEPDEKPDAGKKRNGPVQAAEEQCRGVYKKRLREIGINGEWNKKITDVLIHTANLPARGRMLQVRNQMRQVFGKDHGTELYNRIRPIAQAIQDKGPVPRK